MTTQLNVTQALAAQTWYVPTDESKQLLWELDKDLKKWNAHVSEVAAEYISCVIDTQFSGVRYRFVLRIHEMVAIHAIDPIHLPMSLHATHKLHLRTRNVLKNFLPVAFDRLRADSQFELISIRGPERDATSTSCVWATNTAGLGLTVVTSVTPEALQPIVVKSPSEDQPISMPPMLHAETASALTAYAQ